MSIKNSLFGIFCIIYNQIRDRLTNTKEIRLISIRRYFYRRKMYEISAAIAPPQLFIQPRVYALTSLRMNS